METTSKRWPAILQFKQISKREQKKGVVFCTAPLAFLDPEKHPLDQPVPTSSPNAGSIKARGRNQRRRMKQRAAFKAVRFHCQASILHVKFTGVYFLVKESLCRRPQLGKIFIQISVCLRGKKYGRFCSTLMMVWESLLLIRSPFLSCILRNVEQFFVGKLWQLLCSGVR